MAKRYIRLNWQNRPSVATPLNSVNLNKMDKGIDDCDNAIEDLYTIKLNTANVANNVVTTAAGFALDARQGKILQDQITSQNNNLTNITSIFGTNGFMSYNPQNKILTIDSLITGTIASGSTIGALPENIPAPTINIPIPFIAVLSSGGVGYAQLVIGNDRSLILYGESNYSIVNPVINGFAIIN